MSDRCYLRAFRFPRDAVPRDVDAIVRAGANGKSVQASGPFICAAWLPGSCRKLNRRLKDLQTVIRSAMHPACSLRHVTLGRPAFRHVEAR